MMEKKKNQFIERVVLFVHPKVNNFWDNHPFPLYVHQQFLSFTTITSFTLINTTILTISILMN
jgi:hypothetical protein